MQSNAQKTVTPNGQEKKETPGAKIITVAPKQTTKEKEELKPLEDRIHRINQLWELQGKHTRLVESQVRLKKFLAGVEKDNLQIVIKCTDYSARDEFQTKNIAVIGEVLECLIKSTNEKIKDLEPLLIW